jgi:hypothetical protein
MEARRLPSFGSLPGHLLGAGARLLFGETLVVEFSGRRLGGLLHEVARRPLRAVLAPMPGVTSLLLPVDRHGQPPLRRTVFFHETSGRLVLLRDPDTPRLTVKPRRTSIVLTQKKIGPVAATRSYTTTLRMPRGCKGE